MSSANQQHTTLRDGARSRHLLGGESGWVGVEGGEERWKVSLGPVATAEEETEQQRRHILRLDTGSSKVGAAEKQLLLDIFTYLTKWALCMLTVMKLTLVNWGESFGVYSEIYRYSTSRQTYLCYATEAYAAGTHKDFTQF